MNIVRACVLAAFMVSPVTAQIPDADPADVESIDAIVAAIYDVISGAAGESRDWDRFRSLFAAEARLVPSGRRPGGGSGFRTWTVEEYIEAAGAGLEANGFFENETHRVTEVYGTLAHAFSTYASRRTPDGEVFVRGINSMQLLKDGDRWKVMSIYWSDERSSGEIPAKYRRSN